MTILIRIILILCLRVILRFLLLTDEEGTIVNKSSQIYPIQIYVDVLTGEIIDYVKSFVTN